LGEKAEADHRNHGEFSGLLLGFGMRERMSAMRIYAAELVAPIRNLHPGTGNCF
jgi:hypothetical protein